MACHREARLRAVAIQPLDWLGALSLSKRLDCFRLRPGYGGHSRRLAPRNDSGICNVGKLAAGQISRKPLA